MISKSHMAKTSYRHVSTKVLEQLPIILQDATSNLDVLTHSLKEAIKVKVEEPEEKLIELNQKYMKTGSDRPFKDDRKPRHGVNKNNKKNCKALRIQTVSTTKTRTLKVSDFQRDSRGKLIVRNHKLVPINEHIKLIEVPTSKVIRHESTNAIERKSALVLMYDKIEVNKSKWMDKHPQYKCKEK